MWQDQAKHCPLCGALFAWQEVGGQPRKRCGECGFVLYRNPASASAGVVVNDAGQLLFIRRAIQPYRGYWALPAGYQEIAESPAETVVREVREEAGVEVEPLALLDLLFVPDDPRKPANVAVFLCRALSGELAPGGEESEAAWFFPDALPEKIGFDNYARILSRLERDEEYPDSAWTRLRKLLGRSGG